MACQRSIFRRAVLPECCRRAMKSTKPGRRPLRDGPARWNGRSVGKARSRCGAPVRRGRAPAFGCMPVSVTICSSRPDSNRYRRNKHLFPGSCGKPVALFSPLSGASYAAAVEVFFVCSRRQPTPGRSFAPLVFPASIQLC